VARQAHDARTGAIWRSRCAIEVHRRRPVVSPFGNRRCRVPRTPLQCAGLRSHSCRGSV